MVYLKVRCMWVFSKDVVELFHIQTARAISSSSGQVQTSPSSVLSSNHKNLFETGIEMSSGGEIKNPVL